MTQGQFSSFINLSTAYVCKVEQGEIKFSRGGEIHRKYLDSVKGLNPTYAEEIVKAIEALTI